MVAADREGDTGAAAGRPGLAYVWAAALLVLVAAVLIMVGRRVREARAFALSSVSITSDPSPAEVRFDGRFVGVTPAAVPSVGPGRHTLEVWRQGFLRSAQQLEVGPAPAAVHVRLEAERPGALSVHSEPEGAEVILDGQSRGNAPLELDGLPAGSYRLVLRKAGHEMWSTQVEVREGARAAASAKLENTLLKYLRGAVEADPKDLRSWTALAHFLGCEGRDEESVAAFERGLALCMSPVAGQDDVNRFFQMLARQMNWPGRDRADFRRRIGEAIGRLAEESIADPAAVNRLAQVLERAGRQQEVIDLYRKACVGNGGRDIQLVRNGFAAAMRFRDMAAAEEIAAVARKAHAKDFKIRMDLAEMVMQNWGRYDDRKRPLALAETLYEEAVSLAKPGERTAVDSCAGLAGVRLHAGNNEKAAAAYGEGARSARQGGDMRRWAELELERGSLLLKLERTEEARTLYTTVSKDAPAGKLRDQASAELAKLPAPAPPAPPAPPTPPQAPVGGG
jgi:tetratricopeptide (TPR) repeat protein